MQTAGTPTSEEAIRRNETSNELLGKLVRELSVLLRADLELAAAEHCHLLRQLAIEIAAALAAAAEHDAEDVLKEFIVTLLAPGRAGISLLEPIAVRRPRPLVA